MNALTCDNEVMKLFSPCSGLTGILAKGSEVNGGPLSVVKHLGVPYC